MDHGRRSFLQGNSLLATVIAGYNDVMVSNSNAILDCTDLYATDSTIFSETVYTANIDYSNHPLYTNKKYSLYEEPKWIGYWELTPEPASLRVSTTYKPNWLHRKMTKLFFGWTWHEGKAIK